MDRRATRGISREKFEVTPIVKIIKWTVGE